MLIRQFGFELVHDSRDNEYRGSLVHLQANTVYEVELGPAERPVRLTGRTRSEDFPVGRTTTIPVGDSFEPIVVSESGTPEAYHLVTVEGGERSTIDLVNTANVALTIDADYVIVRGLELKNPARHGILIREGRHDLAAFLARAAKNKVIDEYRRAASRKQDMHREEQFEARVAAGDRKSVV